jgi:hypothetical protein
LLSGIGGAELAISAGNKLMKLNPALLVPHHNNIKIE